MKNTVIITGASSGIGMELAKILAENNHQHLLLVARSKDKLEMLANELISKYKVEVTLLAKDLSNYESALEIFNYCTNENLNVTHLVNNAGFGDFGFFAESNWTKQEQMINLNITTLTYLTHLFLPAMVKNKSGKILNISSIAAFQPGPLMSVYFATKAYVLHFSEAIANELENTGVTVTALCPGPTKSGFETSASLENSKLFKNKNLPSSVEVALYGYNALLKGKKVAIHGTMNYILANTTRFAPRNLVLKIVRFMQDKV